MHPPTVEFCNTIPRITDIRLGLRLGLLMTAVSLAFMTGGFIFRNISNI